MKKQVPFLVLSSRTKLDFISAIDNKQFEIAAAELQRLMDTRFGTGSREPDQTVSITFTIDCQAKGFSVKVLDNALEFIAPTALEILYAVYDMAEEYLGFCFFEPGVDALDTFGGTIKLPVGKYIIRNRVPALKLRGLVQEFPFSDEDYIIADWMVKNKLNLLQTWLKYYVNIPGEMLDYFEDRGIEITGGGHNFSFLIPAEKYAESHPEFFAERNGERIKPSASKSALLLSEQLCTTNPELREELVKNIIELSKLHPRLKSLGLSPNDGFGWCECKECSKLYDKNAYGELYNLSEHVHQANKIYHQLVKYVNRRLREENCAINLGFGAYINYCRPSEGMTVDKGMRSGLANYWRCINHKINDPECPVNSNYAKDLQRWMKVKNGGLFGIYEYYMGVNFYISLPMVHTDDIFDEVDFYEKTGVDSLVTQFHVPHWHVYGINFYCMANAMYHKSRNVTQKRMWNALFGKDADEGKRFYRQVRKLIESAGKCHIPYPYSLFNRTDLADYKNLHEMAKKLHRQSPRDEYRRDLVVWTEYLVRFKTFFDDYHAGKAGVKEIRQFRQWALENCYGKRILRFASFNRYTQNIEQMISEGKKWLHFGLDWEDAYVVKHSQTILK
jgi:hypothetical protein